MGRAAAWLTIVSLVAGVGPVAADTVGQVFRRVNASVVIVRTREQDIGVQPGATTGTVVAWARAW
jgi:hypothetical protein